MKLGERSLPHGLRALGAMLLGCAVAACSSANHGAGVDGGGGEDGGGGDTAPATDGGLDNGEASTTYPAFRPPVPQLVIASANGTTMHAPQVRPVYFAGDTTAGPVDDALTQWFASSAWSAETGEYGIGTATLATPVMLTEAAGATLTDADIKTWLAGKLDGTHPEFGPVDAATLAGEMFMIFYPPTVTITAFGGTLCPNYPAYHEETAIGTGKTAYVVLQRCSGEPEDILPFRAEYEVMATVGNPFPDSQGGYGSFDPDHLAWNVLAGDTELSSGALCFGDEFADGGVSLTPYALSWSNAAIRSYHDPCVPAGSGATPYFVSVPVMNDDLVAQGVATKGIQVPVGQSATVEVQLLSDGATSGPWSVDAQVMPGSPKPSDALSFAFDRTTGTNGEKLHMTVTANQAGNIPFVVTSTLGPKQTVWAGLVGQ